MIFLLMFFPFETPSWSDVDENYWLNPPPEVSVSEAKPRVEYMKEPPLELREMDPEMYCHMAQETLAYLRNEEIRDFCVKLSGADSNFTIASNVFLTGTPSYEQDGKFKKLTYTFRDFSTVSWPHLACSILLAVAFICNVIHLQDQKLIRNRCMGARFLYLTSIWMDIIYCFQAFIYSSVYFIRSTLRWKAPDIEQCIFVAINVFVFRLVVLSNLAIVILRFIALYSPFWFYNRVTLFRAKVAFFTLLSFSSVETVAVIIQCLLDSLAMLTHIYWGITTLICVLMIILCNFGLLWFSYKLFIIQREKLYEKNGTMALFRKLSRTNRVVSRMGLLMFSTAGVQVSNDLIFDMLTCDHRQLMMDTVFKEHADKTKFKSLLRRTGLGYTILVLPHYLVQVLAHLLVDRESWSAWKWAFLVTLFCVDTRFLINPFFNLFTQWQEKREREEAERQEETRQAAIARQRVQSVDPGSRRCRPRARPREPSLGAPEIRETNV